MTRTPDRRQQEWERMDPTTSIPPAYTGNPDPWTDCPVDLSDRANYGPAEPVINCPDHDPGCDCTIAQLNPDLEAQFKAWVAERYRQKWPHLRTLDATALDGEVW